MDTSSSCPVAVVITARKRIALGAVAAFVALLNLCDIVDVFPPSTDTTTVRRVLPVVLEVKEKNSSSYNSDLPLLLPPGIRPRAFERWNSSIPLPCVRESHSWRSLDRGFLFPRPQKAGSSTGSSINLRVARAVARKKLKLPAEESDGAFSRWRHHHGVPRKGYGERDRAKSFLWSIVRDPTTRLVSEFYHFFVARRNRSVTDESFLDFVRTRTREHYYMGLFSSMLNSTRPHRFDPDAEDAVGTINTILRSYNFLAVTERLDESAVALQMLLGLDTADVVYVSTKRHGGYDGGGWHHTCYLIPKTVILPGMSEYFASPEYRERVYWDKLLHQAAHRSLDLTIEKLGRLEFERNLTLFRRAKAAVAEACADVRFPCTETWRRRDDDETDCVVGDMGCGFECIDSVMESLGWDEQVMQ